MGWDVMQIARFARGLALGLTLLISLTMPVSAIPMLLIDAKTLQVLYAEDAGGTLRR